MEQDILEVQVTVDQPRRLWQRGERFGRRSHDLQRPLDDGGVGRRDELVHQRDGLLDVVVGGSSAGRGTSVDRADPCGAGQHVDARPDEPFGRRPRGRVLLKANLELSDLTEVTRRQLCVDHPALLPPQQHRRARLCTVAWRHERERGAVHRCHRFGNTKVRLSTEC